MNCLELPSWPPCHDHNWLNSPLRFRPVLCGEGRALHSPGSLGAGFLICALARHHFNPYMKLGPPDSVFPTTKSPNLSILGSLVITESFRWIPRSRSLCMIHNLPPISPHQLLQCPLFISYFKFHYGIEFIDYRIEKYDNSVRVPNSSPSVSWSRSSLLLSI